MNKAGDLPLTAQTLACQFIGNQWAGGGVELAFGGVGRSGPGREKGLAGPLGFTTLKTVAIKHN